MSRRDAWLAMLVGGILYNGFKPSFGFEPDWKSLWDALYWAGVALLIHWNGATAIRVRER